MDMANKESIASVEQIESYILRRNLDRFPEDFILRLTKEEAEFLVSQNVIPSKRSLGGYHRTRCCMIIFGGIPWIWI